MIVAPYDGSLQPAGIVLPAVVKGEASGRSAVVGLYVDSITHRSVIAESVVRDLQLVECGLDEVLQPDGSILQVPLFVATIWVGNREYWTRVFGYGEASYVCRDVLDQLVVTLDGINQQLIVQADDRVSSE
jgi:hypothetical protein